METLKPKAGPRDFFLWLGAMVALYASVVSFLTLFFEYINRAYPDPLEYWVDPYSGAIRFSIATLVVAFPLFLVLMRLIRSDIQTTPEKKDLWVRKWALYLTLFIAAFTIAVDVVVLINTFLGGEATIRFLLKTLVVFLVAGGGFLHFLADVRGYWVANPAKAQYVGYGALLVVVATIFSGFLIIGSPMDQRLYRFDEQKVQDLQSIQWQVRDHWQTQGALPESLDVLSDPFTGYSVPKDAQTGAAYEYMRVSETTFELCATFNKDSRGNQYDAMRQVDFPQGDLDGPFMHSSGRTCFSRTIDPEKYPVFPKTAPAR
jgi:hypothetical protein